MFKLWQVPADLKWSGAFYMIETDTGRRWEGDLSALAQQVQEIVLEKENANPGFEGEIEFPQTYSMKTMVIHKTDGKKPSLPCKRLIPVDKKTQAQFQDLLEK